MSACGKQRTLWALAAAEVGADDVETQQVRPLAPLVSLHAQWKRQTGASVVAFRTRFSLSQATHLPPLPRQRQLASAPAAPCAARTRHWPVKRGSCPFQWLRGEEGGRAVGRRNALAPALAARMHSLPCPLSRRRETVAQPGHMGQQVGVPCPRLAPWHGAAARQALTHGFPGARCDHCAAQRCTWT